MTKLTLPGLIDPHVHLRDPGQTHKEDFYTGTAAALAGGYTTILDMPNNKIPITTLGRLEEKISIAKQKIVCDVGFYFGSMGDNVEEFGKVKNKVFGLKLYLSETTGNFILTPQGCSLVFFAWARSQNSYKIAKPILVHAEDQMVSVVIDLVKKTGQRTHFCHISTQSDLQQIMKAKNDNLPITCGVTPHHLFLTERDTKSLGPFGVMKPRLGSKKDVEFLWKNLKYIDVVESDHAPHTIDEKMKNARGDTPGQGSRQRAVVRPLRRQDETRRALAGGKDGAGPRAHQRQNHAANQIPYGVPGLETTLALLLTAVSEGRLTVEDIIRLCYKNPKKIFHVPRFDDSNLPAGKAGHRSKIDVDLRSKYTIENKNLFTKCGWSPFNGWEVKGRVLRTFLRGKKVFEDGKILAKKGDGTVLFS